MSAADRCNTPGLTIGEFFRTPDSSSWFRVAGTVRPHERCTETHAEYEVPVRDTSGGSFTLHVYSHEVDCRAADDPPYSWTRVALRRRVQGLRDRAFRARAEADRLERMLRDLEDTGK